MCMLLSIEALLISSSYEVKTGLRVHFFPFGTKSSQFIAAEHLLATTTH